jgi:hypothetical protein
MPASSDETGGIAGRLRGLIMWGDTRLFELAIGMQLLARLLYGKMMHSYPTLMLIWGVAVAAYVITSAVSSDLKHRHRASSLLMVFYSVYVYTASVTLGFPAEKIIYYAFNMVLPALYLKWRIYRECLHREGLQ